MSSLVEAIERFRTLEPHEAVAIRLAVVALVVLIINLVLRLVVRQVHRKRGDSQIFLDQVVITLHRPCRVLVYILGVWSGLLFVEDLLPPSQAAVVPVIEKLLATCLLMVATWIIKRVADEARDHVKLKRTSADGYDDFSAVEAIHVAVLGTIYALAFLILLAIAGVPLTALAGLSVVGGIGAYALTMANQILISNIFAGLVIYFDRPFGPGDWIITQNGTLEGTVEKIGLRLTVVVGFDQRPIYVPNSIFNSTPTVNASRMKNRRIRQFVGVRYSDFSLVSKIMEDICRYLAEHPGLDQRRKNFASLVNGNTNMGSTIEGCFGSSSINLQICAYTKVTSWMKFKAVQDEVMLHIGQLILDSGAEIAFPTTTLDIPNADTPLSGHPPTHENSSAPPVS